MLLFKSYGVLAALAVLIVLHIVGLFVREKIAKILNYVNIGLHILLLPLLLIYKFTIEEGVLCYMISLFAYTLSYYVSYSLQKKKVEKAEEEGNEV